MQKSAQYDRTSGNEWLVLPSSVKSLGISKHLPPEGYVQRIQLSLTSITMVATVQMLNTSARACIVYSW